MVCPHWEVPAAAGRNGHAFLASQREGSKRRLNGFGDHHAERHHLVVRCVGRVAAAAECVEEDVPLDLAFQALFESRARRLNHFNSLIALDQFAKLSESLNEAPARTQVMTSKAGFM